MTVVTQLAAPLDSGPFPEIVDELPLTSEERASAHFSAHTTGGRHMRVSLPRGFELQDGDVLLREGPTAVVVRAADERLLWLTPRSDAIAWSAACYQLGNLHRPARFLEGGVLTPYDPMALQMLRGLDVSIEETSRPFVGRRFGAAGAHHHHAPSHEGHPHHHDDGHHHHPHGAASARRG
ncbi:urease accessory protein UreE [Methylopila musalis]|uniref:Urease accessory protein UreE n=1 Tax=Methylopila musalis TaxID=1134781 RepID=A0ABW3Z4T7_9HYPH